MIVKQKVKSKVENYLVKVEVDPSKDMDLYVPSNSSNVANLAQLQELVSISIFVVLTITILSVSNLSYF